LCVSASSLQDEYENIRIELDKVKAQSLSAALLNRHEHDSKSSSHATPATSSSSSKQKNSSATQARSKLATLSSQDTRRRQLMDTCIVQRLTGPTFFKPKHVAAMDAGVETLGIRFDTSYGNSYFERYYVILARVQQDSKSSASASASSGASKKMFVHKHSIPPSIPINSYEKQFLNRDLPTFASLIHQQLNAYVARREQLKQLHTFVANLGNKTVVVRSSAALDLVHIEFETSSKYAYDIHILYDSGDCIRPTRVLVRMKEIGTDGWQQQQELEQLFHTESIADALSQVLQQS
jgi:Cenp-O kinetochore centromere component